MKRSLLLLLGAVVVIVAAVSWFDLLGREGFLAALLGPARCVSDFQMALRAAGVRAGSFVDVYAHRDAAHDGLLEHCGSAVGGGRKTCFRMASCA